MQPPRRVRASRVSEAFGRAGAMAPLGALRAGLSAALGGLHVSLCLHRVGPAHPGSTQPEKTIPAGELDALVELLLSSRRRATAPWLSVTFDDGYADAAEYIATRAARYPEAEFLFFVCPGKLETGAGFRWDLVEAAVRHGRTAEQAAESLRLPLDVESENARADLRGLTREPAYRLATVEEVRELTRAGNVLLGNHTNCHFPAADLDEERLARDLTHSTADFARLYGGPAHFAFPFGIPGRSFGRRDVEVVRRFGAPVIWSTESRPYRAAERAPGRVVPRYAVLGTWPHRSLAGWIAGRALVYRARGTRHDFGGSPA